MQITIDGVTYNIDADMKRTAELYATDIGGYMMDGSYFNDLMGMYLQYDFVLNYPLFDQNTYSALFEVLTDPVDGHSWVLPYNNGTVQITARVEMPTDDFKRLMSGRKFWKGLQFSVIANHPTKEYTLSQILTRGRAPLPEVAEPEAGDLYRAKTNGTWEQVDYDNADNISY